jgi:diguanylate cyclase (GGDEF)-like protein/PAS domain S-box-containing protein
VDTGALARDLAAVLEAVAPLTGERFIHALVARLTEVLGVAYAFVARREPAEATRARALAVAHRGGPIGPMIYPLAGTPCGTMLDTGRCSLSRAARETYPEDGALVDMGVESYVGTLLTYDGGRVIGWLAVMHTRPLADDAIRRIEAVLHNVGGRAAVELERLEVEAALREAHQSLERRVAERTAELEAANASLQREIEQRRRTEALLRASEEKFATAFRCSPDAMVISCVETGHVLEVNDSFLAMTGFRREEVINQTALDLRFWVDQGQCDGLKRALETGKPVRNMEFEFRIRSGEARIGLLSAETIAVGEVPCVVAVISDVTELKRSEERLIHNAFHDALTDLPNRALFMDRLEHAVDRSRRRKSYAFAVLFLDLDRFKVINDSLGHRAGDQLLVGIARRLEACLRPGDTVARLGGDEFTILLEDVGDASDATRIAERVQNVVKLPLTLNGQEVYTSGSIGIAHSSTGYQAAEDLLRDADLAMYRAKSLGRARTEVFDRAMHERAVGQLRLETDLRHAVDRGELALVYQPIVCLTSRAVRGFEALVRWRHPERGLVMPELFIPAAEESGLIVAVGEWVLHEACRQARRWHEQLGERRPGISVNLSSRQFLQPDLPAQVAEALRRTGLDPRYLHLEITESTVMENGEVVVAMMRELRELGVHLCLDDFGTGYSSLSYLHDFPIDTLKIDRSFVGRMGSSGENVEIIRTIVSLGHNLDKRVIAEGVETVEQVAQLRALGCEYGQGHFFAVPLDGETALGLLDAPLPR